MIEDEQNKEVEEHNNHETKHHIEDEKKEVDENSKEEHKENHIKSEKKEHITHTTKPHKKTDKKDIWKIISGVLFVLLMISIFSGSGEEKIGKDKAAEKAIEYINNNLLQAESTATINEVEELNGMYLININIEGKDFNSYMTKDGQLLFPSGIELVENGNNPTVQQAQEKDAAPQAAATAPSVDMGSLIDDDTVKGNPDAPVTIVEWSDFECPYCTRFYTQTLGLIREKYIDTGKVKMVYRDFPLNFHRNAQKAAEAAECAGEQDKFWEMHDKLFDNGVTGGTSSFKRFAGELGLDTSEFDECLDSGSMASEVAKDMQDGQAVGISGTPGFIINGKLLSGAQPFTAFEEVIEAELAK